MSAKLLLKRDAFWGLFPSKRSICPDSQLKYFLPQPLFTPSEGRLAKELRFTLAGSVGRVTKVTASLGFRGPKVHYALYH
jgi:hypothetical protein